LTMWYEVLPSVALVFGLLCVPPYGSWAANYLLLNGKSMVRKWEEHPKDFHLYLRDRRITGSEYKPQGLEAIPDKE